MAIFVDEHFIVDTAHIVCATRCQGQHEYDGLYGLMLLVQIGDAPKRVYVDFPDEYTRNTAFVALGRLLRAEDADIVALEDD